MKKSKKGNLKRHVKGFDFRVSTSRNDFDFEAKKAAQEQFRGLEETASMWEWTERNNGMFGWSPIRRKTFHNSKNQFYNYN